jgi:hypothetical protein
MALPELGAVGFAYVPDTSARRHAKLAECVVITLDVGFWLALMLRGRTRPGYDLRRGNARIVWHPAIVNGKPSYGSRATRRSCVPKEGTRRPPLGAEEVWMTPGTGDLDSHSEARPMTDLERNGMILNTTASRPALTA